MSNILLIDDDQALAEPLRDYLQQFDLQLVSVTHPNDGLQLIRLNPPDLVILDIMLPDMDGFEVCRQIRRSSDLPIIMLTARGDVMDRVVGLELGADDYLAKPFEPRELVARIQNILKRAHEPTRHGRQIEIGELSLNLEQQQVICRGTALELTTMEYRLLELLARSPGKPFSRDEIISVLKGTEAELYTRSVDILVSRVRHKLQPLDYIKTVWGTGYSLVGPAV
ncbi:MAG: response regulator transcription factor [Gammaproteobacteria bacterium]|nr:response regulator transcription factor [Gammaproteobacteria bacterium]